MAGRKAIKGKTLYKILFFGVIFAVASMVVLAVWGVREIRRDAAIVAVENSARGVSGAVTVLVNAVTMANDEIGTNVISSLKPANLRKGFAATFSKHRSLASIMVSDADGLLYVISQRADGMVEGVVDRNTGDLAWTHIRPNGKQAALDSRPGFRRKAVDTALAEEFAHLKPGDVDWRSAYGYHSEGESWLTAAALAESNGQNIMISYIFPIDAVVNQLGGAEKGSAEKIFLYWQSGKVLPIKSTNAETVDSEHANEALTPDKVNDPVVATAASLLSGNPGSEVAPFSYQIGGETWWAYVMPLEVFDNTMSLGVAVPRRNIVSALTSDTFIQVFGGLLVALGAVVLFVLHRNKSRIEVMGQRMKAAKTPQDILHLIAEGEGGSLEFKQTLRFNLKAGKNGKEIEHASLKSVAGFFNSDGGTLLIGVADSGEITGFPEDKFENEDKALLHFNNLVNQHIGTEFSRYLDTAIIEVQGKLVLRAYCMPAAAPAILTHGKNEEFYVRSGPASRSLTLSQFYEWLQNH